MPKYDQPSDLCQWTSGDATQVSAPTPSQRASGFTASERPTYSLLNYLFYSLGKWVAFLKDGVNAVLLGSVQETDWRLINGGSWSWNASSGTLAWSEAAQISMPGLQDAANNVAAGSVNLAAGQVAYISLNTPFAATGTVTSGSKTVADLDFESGIVVGASVSGAGIQPGTNVVSVSQADSSITLSVAPTASGSKVRLVFATSGALVVSAADVASFAPANNTAVIARCIAGAQNHVLLGLNAATVRVLDGESKRLLGNGYVTTMRATAGAAISARQPVYLSPGASDGRTAGYVYPLDVSTAGTPVRAAFAGLAASTVASGSTVEVVMSGRMPGFATLTPGQTYYANPSSPTALQASAPVTAGQFVVPVGAAASADSLVIAPTPSPVVQAVGSTTTFAGPISAPSVNSAAGFKSVVQFGYAGVSSVQANTSYPFQYLVQDANNSTFKVTVPRTMSAAGSIVAMGLYIQSGSNAGLAGVQLLKNGTSFATLSPGLGLSTLNRAVTKFSAGDTLQALLLTGANSLQSSYVAAVDLHIELSA